MAVTGVITLSTSSTAPGQVFPVVLTLTNGGVTSVNVTSIVPTTTPHSGTAQSVATSNGAPLLTPSTTVAIAGSSGTLAIGWSDVAYAPTGGGSLFSPATQQYDIGALIYISDGSIVTATTATLTVTAPTY